MITITNNVAAATPGKFIRRKGTDIYASAILLTDPTLTAEDFEEVDEIPQPTDPTQAQRERSQAIVSLIRQRYSVDDEIAILRQRDTKPDEFAAYNDFAEQCKAQADIADE